MQIYLSSVFHGFPQDKIFQSDFFCIWIPIVQVYSCIFVSIFQKILYTIHQPSLNLLSDFHMDFFPKMPKVPDIWTQAFLYGYLK